MKATVILAAMIVIGTGLANSTAVAAGLMMPMGSTGSGLAIKSHRVNVVIENGYAITQVDQVFSNSKNKDLEAIYSFPVPEKGVVSEFTVWIDGQPVIGEVLKKERARQLYEQEKAAGRTAGLTEKQQHYRFEVAVSPVRAQQDTRIRLVYMQPAHVDSSMGRYVYPLEEGETDDQANAFWSYNPVVEEDFSLTVKLRSGYPVNAVRLPQHPMAQISQLNAQEWQVHIGNAHKTEPSISTASTTKTDEIEIETEQASAKQPKTAMRLDKDIVLYWRLASDLPGAIDLVTHREPGKKRGTFMMTLTPGDDLKSITGGRDWVFVLDMSGSMSGKYQTLMNAVQSALGRLSPEDRFQLTLFDDQVLDLTSQWIPATTENIQYWGQQLANTKPRGGTNLFAGLESGLSKLDADRTSAIILVTDGEANVGVTEKKQFLSLMKQRDVRLFTAVMGNGANRPLLNAMTQVSNGFAVSVSNSDDIAGKLMEFTSKVRHQALHGLKLDINGIKTSDLTPDKLTSLYRGEQLIIMGHYWQAGVAAVTLSGQLSGENKTYQTRLTFPDTETRFPEIERLWAYAKIQSLQDQIDYLGVEGDYKNAIIDLAVEHSIVTDHTSMIVMRDEQLAAQGIERRNKQRIAKEQQAQTNRNQTPVVNHQADSQDPAFKLPRVSHSSGGGGGGSMDLWLLLPLLLLGMLSMRRKRPSPFI